MDRYKVGHAIELRPNDAKSEILSTGGGWIYIEITLTQENVRMHTGFITAEDLPRYGNIDKLW